MKIETVQMNWTEPAPKRLHEIVGNEFAKRAIEVALAGGHEIVLLSTVRSPASDLLRAAARIAHENRLPFKGHVVPVCECGSHGSPKVECSCSVADLKRYARKVLPALKTAAIVIETVEPSVNDQRRGAKHNEPEAALVARVLAARGRTPPPANPEPDADDMLRMAAVEAGADRGKALAVASTVARMDDSGVVRLVHVAEAVQYQHRHLANWTDDFEEASA